MSVFGRERLTEIFNNTSYLCKNDSLLKEMVDSANKKQMVILEGDKVIRSEKKFDKPAKVVVSKKRTLRLQGHTVPKRYASITLLLSQIQEEGWSVAQLHRKNVSAGAVRCFLI